MDLNAAIIDSRVSGLMDQLREDAKNELGKRLDLDFLGRAGNTRGRRMAAAPEGGR